MSEADDGALWLMNARVSVLVSSAAGQDRSL
jgi:hypothetical protein